jgi:hypothetical protein
MDSRGIATERRERTDQDRSSEPLHELRMNLMSKRVKACFSCLGERAKDRQARRARRVVVVYGPPSLSMYAIVMEDSTTLRIDRSWLPVT